MARARVLGTKSAGGGPELGGDRNALTVPYRVLLLLVVGVGVFQEQADGVSQLRGMAGPRSAFQGPTFGLALLPEPLPQRTDTPTPQALTRLSPRDGRSRRGFGRPALSKTPQGEPPWLLALSSPCGQIPPASPTDPSLTARTSQ